MGPADTEGPRLVSHNSLPSRASKATNWPSRPPPNSTFDAVVKIPPSVEGADNLKVHLRSPVLGSIAMMELNTSSVVAPPRGNAPVKPWPSWNSGGSSPFTYVLELFSQAGM